MMHGQKQCWLCSPYQSPTANSFEVYSYWSMPVPLQSDLTQSGIIVYLCYSTSRQTNKQTNTQTNKQTNPIASLNTPLHLIFTSDSRRAKSCNCIRLNSSSPVYASAIVVRLLLVGFSLTPRSLPSLEKTKRGNEQGHAQEELKRQCKERNLKDCVILFWGGLLLCVNGEIKAYLYFKDSNKIRMQSRKTKQHSTSSWSNEVGNGKV